MTRLSGWCNSPHGVPDQWHHMCPGRPIGCTCPAHEPKEGED